MQKIPLKMAAPGMILADPVQREDGLVLVGAGAELTESLINRFSNSGITAITVKGKPLSGDGGGDYKSLVENLDPLFRHYTENKFMMGLRTIFKKYFENKLAESLAARIATEEAEEQEKS